MNIEKIDSLKLANSIPSENDKTNMIAKLVCETADMQRRIDDLLIENKIEKIEKTFSLYFIDSKIDCKSKDEIDYIINELIKKVDEIVDEVNKLKEDKK